MPARNVRLGERWPVYCVSGVVPPQIVSWRRLINHAGFQKLCRTCHPLCYSWLTTMLLAYSWLVAAQAGMRRLASRQRRAAWCLRTQASLSAWGSRLRGPRCRWARQSVLVSHLPHAGNSQATSDAWARLQVADSSAKFSQARISYLPGFACVSMLRRMGHAAG